LTPVKQGLAELSSMPKGILRNSSRKSTKPSSLDQVAPPTNVSQPVWNKRILSRSRKLSRGHKATHAAKEKRTLQGAGASKPVHFPVENRPKIKKSRLTSSQRSRKTTNQKRGGDLITTSAEVRRHDEQSWSGKKFSKASIRNDGTSFENPCLSPINSKNRKRGKSETESGSGSDYKPNDESKRRSGRPITPPRRMTVRKRRPSSADQTKSLLLLGKENTRTNPPRKSKKSKKEAVHVNLISDDEEISHGEKKEAEQSQRKRRYIPRRSKRTLSRKLDSTPYVVYRPPGNQEGTGWGISIISADLERLSEGEYLNDSLIDFYLTLWFRELCGEKIRQDCHVFSTFFFTKLRGCKKESAEERYKKVRRWTKNVDIFEKKYLFVPVNELEHWTLMIVCFPGKIAALAKEQVEVESEFGPTRKKRSSSDKEGKDHPYILYFDSLKCRAGGSKSANLLRDYLTEAYKEKLRQKVDADVSVPEKGKIAEDRETAVADNLRISARLIPCRNVKAPQQDNNCDCGVYLLHYAELFSKTPFKDVSDVDRQDWFPKRDIAEKRRQLRDYINNLHIRQDKEKKKELQEDDIALEHLCAEEESEASGMPQAVNETYAEETTEFTKRKEQERDEGITEMEDADEQGMERHISTENDDNNRKLHQETASENSPQENEEEKGEEQDGEDEDDVLYSVMRSRCENRNSDDDAKDGENEDDVDSVAEAKLSSHDFTRSPSRQEMKRKAEKVRNARRSRHDCLDITMNEKHQTMNGDSLEYCIDISDSNGDDATTLHGIEDDDDEISKTPKTEDHDDPIPTNHAKVKHLNDTE